ncbi:hypothetical protein PSN45_003013 [Yamadazyma tenuis]|uniref:MFS general substrate transporter n=1 Tax=Candida tenuis (strain ATCC 10573 / BCRC 21748 / CBS 615 / JCM 9827 / NBRC 10315 / NRRL Y-1498 / VKM Y-70) TaxID=590646 RepID=G3AXI5_CANTC|nr:MFS general substrate transporter [Yamadazyma tenuis ATCC 10573]EGV66391.1 MFS general substrate transporter [Yamadazyma tenuis ATCC 10573]WEJ95493.1 hypothetical protein PSN45_003013 [Yamadazyma tenuis]
MSSLESKEVSLSDVDQKKNALATTVSKLDDETFGEIDPKKENQLLHKFDRRIMPILSLIYFLSFLDRSNIGNAKVAGLYEQLELTNSQYSLVVSIFYVTYILSEVPAVLIARRIGFRLFLCTMMFGWAIVTLCTAFVRDFWSLTLCRLLLGLLEGGVFPNMSLYISILYKRQEQGRRLSYLYVCSCMSGAFGGLIATGITKIHSNGTLDSWSYLYIIEGAISAVAVVCLYWLPDDPAHAKFLNQEELEVMAIREEQRKFYMGSDKFDKKEFVLAIKDPKLYMSVIIQFSVDLVLYGFSTFLPSILSLQLGFTSLRAQYLSIPVYFVSALGVYLSCYFSDKMNKKFPFILGVNALAFIGYVILLTNKKAAVNYFATYLIAIPLYSAVSLNITWINNNMAPHYRRATALGFNQTFGNLAGVIAGQVYRAPPHYYLGNGFSLGCVVVSSTTTILMYQYLKKQNQLKDNILNGAKDTRKVRSGCEDPEFVYVY